MFSFKTLRHAFVCGFAVVFFVGRLRGGTGEESDRLFAQVCQAHAELSYAEISLRAHVILTRSFTNLPESARAHWKKEGVDTDRPHVFSDSMFSIFGESARESGVDRKGMEYVKCRNPEYAFLIARSERIPKYAIQLLEKNGDESRLAERIKDEVADVISVPLAGFYMIGIPLSELFDSLDFKLKNCSELVQNEKRLVKVEFEYKPLRPPRMLDAYILINPMENWRIEQYSYSQVADTHVEGKITYRSMNGGVPIPSKITQIGLGSRSPATSETVWDIEVLPEQVDAKEFFLSHYGLPEPNFAQRMFGGWAYYFLGAAVCVCASFGVSRWRRRAR